MRKRFGSVTVFCLAFLGLADIAFGQTTSDVGLLDKESAEQLPIVHMDVTAGCPSLMLLGLAVLGSASRRL